MPGEPGTEERTGASRFVVQEHHARSLHWDFRLERDGVLVSWALPKGVPIDPKVNHLAVRTEDHPLAYADFQGDIPKGEYGAGRVSIWDRGPYAVETWSEREVKVVLHGSKVAGRYVLFRTSGKSWMIHRMDPPPGDHEPMPERVRPMLARRGALPADGAGWAFETAWAGERAIGYVEGGRVRLSGTGETDLGPQLPELRQLGEHLGATTTVLDGVVVAPGPDGTPDAERLERRMAASSPARADRLAREAPVLYVVFDLVYLDGRRLETCTYDERRDALDGLGLSGATFMTSVRLLDAHGPDVLAAALEQGFRGIVAKRRTSPYREGRRSDDWVEVRGRRRPRKPRPLS
jgi:bifunctional non-homologous end joining protein LigD